MKTKCSRNETDVAREIGRLDGLAQQIRHYLHLAQETYAKTGRQSAADAADRYERAAQAHEAAANALRNKRRK